MGILNSGANIESSHRGSSTSREEAHFTLQSPLGTLTQSKMRMTLAVLCLLVTLHDMSEASPLGVCIRNCAQCKKMFGDYFEGQMCADWCVKFKGKLVPDCEDIDTIAQFLNKLE